MPGFCLGAHEVYNVLGKIWIIFAVVIVNSVAAFSPVCSHEDVVSFRVVYKNDCFGVFGCGTTDSSSKEIDKKTPQECWCLG